jgi:putative Holliday junction resolvase
MASDRIMKEDRSTGRSQQDTYLGFDYGSRNIGVAVGQLVTCTATALETIHVYRQQPDWKAISRLLRTWQPHGLVVGLCYQQDGSENPITQPILRFCRQLEGRYGLPVETVDEMLSTFESKQLFFDSIESRTSDFWEIKDQISAQLILQTWLRQRQGQRSGTPSAHA